MGHCRFKQDLLMELSRCIWNMEADSQTVTERLSVTYQVMLSDLQIHWILLPLLCNQDFEKMVHDRINETLSINKSPWLAAGKRELCDSPLTHLVIIFEF